MTVTTNTSQSPHLNAHQKHNIKGHSFVKKQTTNQTKKLQQSQTLNNNKPKQQSRQTIL